MVFFGKHSLQMGEAVSRVLVGAEPFDRLQDVEAQVLSFARPRKSRRVAVGISAYSESRRFRLDAHDTSHLLDSDRLSKGIFCVHVMRLLRLMRLSCLIVEMSLLRFLRFARIKN